MGAKASLQVAQRTTSAMETALAEGRKALETLLSLTQTELDRTLLEAVDQVAPRKGRETSRRAPSGWFPELEAKRKELGQIALIRGKIQPL